MNNDTEAFAQTVTHSLERRKVAASLVVSQQAKLRVDPGHLTDDLLLRLESYVLAEKLVGDTQVITGSLPFPSSPWQFFKQRHAGSWWLRWLVERRPVRMDSHRYQRAVTFERYAHYPKATLRTPELGRPVVFESFREDWRP